MIILFSRVRSLLLPGGFSPLRPSYIMDILPLKDDPHSEI